MDIKPIAQPNKTIDCPPDKSITHRAVMSNAIARGRATVHNALMGEDCLSTIDCMRRLGAEIETDGTTVYVRGAGKLQSADLYVGNSGTTVRLLTGALAGRVGSFTLDGDASLRTRPMTRVITPLSQMGAKIESLDGKTPLSIRGEPLTGIRYSMPVASAQVKSAVLLAGLCADGETTVIESVPSRDHTERMLAAMGADIVSDGLSVTVRRSTLQSTDVTVCGDVSSAAYPLVLAACIPGSRITVKNVGTNPTRDGLLAVLRESGANLTLDNDRTVGEPSADITMQYAPLRPFAIGGALIPRLIDEIPALAVLACFIEGESVIRDAKELKVKESDRIATTVAMLTALGADVKPTDDGMIIRGKGYLPGGGTVDAGLDHRIAMSAAIAMAASRTGGTLLRGEVCAVSYPTFFGEVL